MPFRPIPTPFSARKSGGRGAGRALRLFRSQQFCEFLLAYFVLKNYRFCTVRPSLGCNGAALRVWRRPRCVVVRPSLQSRKGLTASSSRSCGKVAGMVRFVSGCKLVYWIIYQKKLINIPDFLSAHACDICARGRIILESPSSRWAKNGNFDYKGGHPAFGMT